MTTSTTNGVYRQPFGQPFGFGYQVFTFRVLAPQGSEQVQTLRSWAEAWAYAAQLFNQTANQFGPGARILISDQQGVERSFPSNVPLQDFAQPFYSQPFGRFPRHRFRRRFTLSPTVVTVAGPFAHLSEDPQSTLGQFPTEQINGAQRLLPEARDQILGTALILYPRIGLVPDVPAMAMAPELPGYTLYTAERFQRDFPGEELPSPGFPPAPPGVVYVVNIADFIAFGQSVGSVPAEDSPGVRIIVTPDLETAKALAPVGGEWAIFDITPTARPETPAPERRVSPAAIVAGIAAAAVAALLIFA